MELIATILALGATICWGMDQVLGKLVLRDLDSLTFYALRPVLAILFVVPYVLLVEQISYGSWGLIAVVLLAGIFAEFIGGELYFHIIKRSEAHLVIPVGNTDPLWATLTAILLLGEEVRPIVFISIAFIMFGTFLLAQESGRGSREKWRTGVLLALFVAFLWGVSMPMTKYCLDGGMSIGTAQIIRVMVALVGPNLLLFASNPSLRVRPITSRVLKLNLISGFLALFLGFLLWLEALKMESASVIGPFLGAKVAFGFLFCAIILREKFTKRAIFGMLSILLGLLLVAI